MQRTDRLLRGCRVLLTRAADDAEPLMSRLHDMGAEVLLLPAFEILPAARSAPLDDALRNLSTYDWIAFTSRHAVDAVFERLPSLRISGPLPDTLRVAAVGPSTAARLEARGVNDILVPQGNDAGAVGLGAAMCRAGMKDKQVLIPAGNLARPELRQILHSAGAAVHQVVAYRSEPPRTVDGSILSALCHGAIDVVAVASPSAIDSLVTMLGKDTSCLRRAQLVAIGPTTAAAINQLDPTLRPYIGKTPSVETLIDLIVSAYCGD